VPSVSTAASGRFRAVIDDANGLVHYELTFAGLESPVRMAHIHLAQRGVNGGIVLWLCQTVAPFVAPAPRVSPTCPQTGTVTGTLSATDVITQTTQGIAAGEIAEVIAAIRAGVAYVNVHTDGSPGGEIRGQLKED
jgi:CHRD domain